MQYENNLKTNDKLTTDELEISSLKKRLEKLTRMYAKALTDIKNHDQNNRNNKETINTKSKRNR